MESGSEKSSHKSKGSCVDLSKYASESSSSNKNFFGSLDGDAELLEKFSGWTYPQYSFHKIGHARDMKRHWWQTYERVISVRGDSSRPEVVNGHGDDPSMPSGI